MAYSERDRMIALAGIYQAAWCAQGIARRGMADSDAMAACIGSIVNTDAEDVPSVFGGIRGIAPGLRQFIHQLKGGNRRDVELTRYVIALMHLERKLAGNPEMTKVIGEGIENARIRLEHFHLLHGNILAQLADIYSQTISNLQPRIIVHGEALHLQNPDNANKIRTLLLAGIRAAWLWHQVGGRRRHILLWRRRMLETAGALLDEIEG
jgi:high frequency lysogenization protein